MANDTKGEDIQYGQGYREKNGQTKLRNKGTLMRMPQRHFACEGGCVNRDLKLCL